MAPASGRPSDAERGAECAAAAVPVTRPGGAAVCSAREVNAYIVEPTHVHREVLPSAVRLVHAAGFPCVTVLHKTPNGEHGIIKEMARWGLRVRVVYGEAKMALLLRAAPPALLLINTMEYSLYSHTGAPSNSLWFRRMLEALDAQPSPPLVVAGCHNAELCVEPYMYAREHFPRLRVALMGYHPAVPPLLEALGARPKPFASLPTFLGPEQSKRTTSAESVVRFLVPGNIHFDRRCYDRLHAVARELRGLPCRVEVLAFGACSDAQQSCPRYAALARAVAQDNPRVSLLRRNGSFASLFDSARAANFVLPLVEHCQEVAGEAVGAEHLQQYNTRKLSSAVAVALAFRKPIVGATQLLAPYAAALHQTPLVYDGSAASVGLPLAARAAVEMVQSSDGVYSDLREQMCTVRASLFNESVRDLSRLLGEHRQEAAAAPTAEPMLRAKAHPIVWLTGLPRSGTDWVARVVGSANTGREPSSSGDPQRAMERVAMREPFNVDCPTRCDGINDTRTLKRAAFEGHYVWLDEGSDLSARYRTALKIMFTACAPQLEGQSAVPGAKGPIVVKDPVGFYATEWLSTNFQVQRVLVLVRSPLSWAGSMLKAGYTGDHLDCKTSRKCSWDRLLAELEVRHLGKLRAIARDAERGGGFGGALGSMVESLEVLLDSTRDARAAPLQGLLLLYSVFFASLISLRARNPAWLIVRNEDLIVAPVTTWASILSELNLAAGATAAAKVLRETSLRHLDRRLRSHKRSTFSVNRVPLAELTDWSRQLSSAQAQLVRRTTRQFASGIYSEPFWWEDGGGGRQALPPRFVEVSDDVGLGGNSSFGLGLGFSCGDLDGDGFVDLFFGSRYNQQYALPTVYVSRPTLNGGRRFESRLLRDVSNEPKLHVLFDRIPTQGHGEEMFRNRKLENFERHSNGTSRERRPVMPDVATDACVVMCVEQYANVGKHCCVRSSAFQPRSAPPSTATLAALTAEIAATAPTAHHVVACALASDFDNDGDTDLFVHYQHSIVADGAKVAPALERTALFFDNVDNRQFVSESSAVLFGGYRTHISHDADKCAPLDYDNDGRIDILVSTPPLHWSLEPNGTTAGTFDMRNRKFAVGHPHLLQNGMPSDGHWLKVELRAEPIGGGVQAVQIGSVVEVETASGTQRQVCSDRILDFVQGDQRLHFGLGSDSKPQVRVLWSDGLISQLEMVPACVDRLLRVLRTSNGVKAECAL